MHPAGGDPGQAQRGGDRLGPRVGETHLLDGGHQPCDQLAGLPVDQVRQPGHRAFRQLAGERSGQLGLRVPKQVGTVAHVEVDQLPAFDVPDPIALSPLDDERLGDGLRSHAAAHTAGNDLTDRGELRTVRGTGLRVPGCLSHK